MGPMLRWFVFTIGFGLLPFGFSALVHRLHQPGARAWQPSPELLFFSVMVCASQMAELFHTLSVQPGLRPRRSTARAGLFAFFLLGGVWSSALYGLYVAHDLAAPATLVQGRCIVEAVSQVQPAASGVFLGVTECDRWLVFRQNLYRLSVWISILLGVVGTFAEWLRTRRRT